MVSSAVTLPAKWENFLKQTADDHEVDLNSIVGELCEWAFSNPESKKQFVVWLDYAFPPKGEAEEQARAADDQETVLEEEAEEESEEESHEDRNYNEDRQ